MSRLPRVLMQMNGKVLTNPCHRQKQKQAVRLVYNQTTEFRLTFSKERERVCVFVCVWRQGRATGMMKHVLLVHTGGDLISACSLTTSL